MTNSDKLVGSEMRGTEVQASRWRFFLVVEGVLIVGFMTGTFLVFSRHYNAKAFVLMIIAVGTWLFFSLPICFLYLIGRPPIITLAPLLPSADSRAFKRALRARPEFRDDEFYARFYHGTGVPKDIPIRLRRSLLSISPILQHVYPADYLLTIEDELDVVDLVRLIEDEFGVRFSIADVRRSEGTFDGFVRVLQAKSQREPPELH
jgi:hypothetical protein